MISVEEGGLVSGRIKAVVPGETFFNPPRDRKDRG